MYIRCQSFFFCPQHSQLSLSPTHVLQPFRTGSCPTSAVDERSPHYCKVSECERREGEEGNGREKKKKKKKGEESVPIAVTL